MSTAKIIELLKSGNFTIAYHDNGQCDLYEGCFKYENLPDKSICEFDMTDNFKGYAPTIVCYLVKALGGKVDSI